MFPKTSDFRLAPATERISPSSSTVRALMALVGLALGVAYTVATVYVSSHMPFELTFLPAKVAVVVLSITMLIGAVRNNILVALGGIAYAFGLFINVAGSNAFFHDPIYFAQVYTGMGAVVGVVMVLLWIERRMSLRVS